MLKNISEFKGFSVINSLLCQCTDSGSQLLMIPDVNHKGEGIRSLMIENVHKIVGHYSYPKTLTYMHKHYWWPTMEKDVEQFCMSCETCQTMKQHTSKQLGLLHNLLIPHHLWSAITMDLVEPFHESMGRP